MKLITRIIGLILLQAYMAQAALTIDVIESDGNVVAVASGSVNTAGLIKTETPILNSQSYTKGSGLFAGFDGEIALGTGNWDQYPIDNSTLVFSTGAFEGATSSSGLPVGITSRNDIFDSIHVPLGYVSGSPIDATATWAGNTIAGMGLIPGSYVFSWGNNATADSLTVNIGAATPPATPTNYFYTGQNFTNVTTGTYTTAMRVTGSITTSSAIPPNSTNFNIGTIATSWTFTDGVHTISDTDGVFHTAAAFLPKFTTNGAGEITSADVFVTNDPIATAIGETNRYITSNQSVGFDHGVLTARCEGLTEGVCTVYRFGPRGIVNNALGTWTVGPPLTYAVRAQVSGLTSGTVTLQNNSTDNIVRGNGNYAFATRLVNGDTYSVTVLNEPSGQTCTVIDGNGTISGIGVIVDVNCTTDTPPPPAPPVTSFTDNLPSGASGTLSFTSSDSGCTFATEPQFLTVASVSPQPPAQVTPVDGVIQFTISGCTPGATVTMSMDYGSALPSNTVYWKVGSPWFPIPANVTASVIQFNITDGGLGDDDGAVNGVIVDPGAAVLNAPATPGPGPSGAAPAQIVAVPTMPGWALLLLSIVLGYLALASRKFVK